MQASHSRGEQKKSEFLKTPCQTIYNLQNGNTKKSDKENHSQWRAKWDRSPLHHIGYTQRKRKSDVKRVLGESRPVWSDQGRTRTKNENTSQPNAIRDGPAAGIDIAEV